MLQIYIKCYFISFSTEKRKEIKMKLKKVRALLTALAFTVGTALCVSTVTWANSLTPDPILIINEQGEIVESAIQSDRTLYFGSTVEQDITKTILQKLCTADAIKKDSLTAKDVSITLKSELVFDEEKNEFVESENDIKDVMTVKDDEITFSKTGFFLAEVSIKDDKCNVIFDIDDKVLAYADLNDWVVLNNTKSPDFSVKFDSKEIKSVKYDDSKVKVGTDGKYVLTYTITDAENHVVKKEVLVTVGDKKVVNELSEKGVWVANGKAVAGNSNTTKPVVKPENKPSKPSKPNNSGNQNPSVPNRPEKPETPETPENPDKPEKPEKPQHVHTFGDWQVKKPATCEKTGLEERFCTDTDCNKKEIRKIPALGHDLKETVITEPTCGTAGSKEITCSRCDFKDTKEIPATGNHAYGDWVIVKEATCTEEGLRTQTCANCGDVIKEVIPKVDHTWNEGEVSKQPTCTENGERTFTCTVCQETKTEVAEDLPAIGHNWSDWEVKDATCTEDGLKTRHCQNDGCNEVESEVIPATGHTFGEWEVTTPATCETEGQETRTCADCNETETRVIKALGHEFVDYTYNNDATCEKDGTETAKCTRCDKTDTRVAEGTKLGHELKEEILTNPTCETAGSKKITCSRCDYEEIVKIPAIGHKWNDGEVTTAPTCTTEGVKTFTCQNDESHTRTEVIPALGHDLKETIVKAPTCTEAGSKKVACTRCDYEDSQVEIPALGHKWDDGVVTKAPTCTEAGVKTFTCQNDKNHTRTEVIPATGHDLHEEVIKPATCTEKGQVRVFCTKCDFEEIKETESFGHDLKEEVIKAPTCTEKGETKVTCSNCDFEEIKYTDALGHNMVDGESTLPTCLTNGLTSKHCTRCDHHEDTVIPALGHNWTDIAEKGHWDTKLVWVSYDECRKCGFQTEDPDVMDAHCLECGGTYTTKEKQVEKKTWIVDVPAHKECDRCHVTQ